MECYRNSKTGPISRNIDPEKFINDHGTTMYIALNPRWRAKVLDDDRYVLFRRRADNVWDIQERIEGPRRALLKRINALGIVTTRTAQEQLDTIPECAGFRPDPVEEDT